MRIPIGRRRAVRALLALAAACEHPPAAGPCFAPEVLESRIVANPGNVLSAITSVGSRGADSVMVRFGPAGGELESRSAAVPASSGKNAVPVLGLLPEQPYQLQAVAFNACGGSFGPELSFTTGPLPEDLPRYVAGGSDPSPGFVVFAAGWYGLAIDNDGRVVWYHRFPAGPGLNFQPQPNGRYLARPQPPAGETAQWLEIDPLGVVTRRLACANGLPARPHDMIAEEDGSYWLMCDETRVMDLSDLGGVAGARVTGTAIQHLSAAGELRFAWSPFDHFAITDLEAAERTGPTVNWTHGNAIALDEDGLLLVSFRNLSEITKIDPATGTVRWRLGGRANQFRLVETPEPAFRRQHGLRSLGGGALILLDNLGEPGASRAERYLIDEATRSARLGGTYSSEPGVIAELGGTTQRLPGGRVLVSYGSGGRVEEYDELGNVVWRIEGRPGYVFRAHRIRSLYQPGLPLR